jgi:hypothetical protein
MSDIVLTLDRRTAGYLAAMLRDVEAHLAEGWPIDAMTSDEIVRLGEVRSELEYQLAMGGSDHDDV